MKWGSDLVLDAIGGGRTVGREWGEALFLPALPSPRRRERVNKGRALGFEVLTDNEKAESPHMNEKTQHDYRSLAANFYATRIKGGQPSPKRICDALAAAATDYRPAYWRRLRNALAFDQAEKGYSEAAARIAATRNPATLPTSTTEPKAKQKRVRAVSVADERKLLEHFQEGGDRQSYAAVMLSRITGARPAEMAGIRVEGDRVTITGAKKSHGGQRGADRVLVVTAAEAQLVAACAGQLQGANLGAVQDRIRAAGQRLWPQRAALPSLYSWRHQLGSELKASGLDRREVAYLMGHQSTASVDRYGSRRTARGGRVPRAPEGQTFDQVRERHSEPPARVTGADLRKGAESLKALKIAEKAAMANQKLPERQYVSEENSLSR